MIRKNIVANIIGRGWSFISVYLFIPLYLKFLGIEAYGLVGFYSTLLGVMIFADMGLTATLNREIARLSGIKGASGEMRDLLRTYESIYVLSSLIVALLIYLLAPAIAEHWLQAETLKPSDIAAAIRLMGLAIAFQLPSGLFIGGLMGLERQVQANLLQITWGLYRGIGAVFLLWMFAPTIIMFASWQVISNIIYCLWARNRLWQALSSSPGQSNPRFNLQILNSTWHYAAGMAGMGVLSILMTQIDKIVISKLMSLEMLGYYGLATILATAPIMLANPISMAVFPRLTRYAEIGNQAELDKLYHNSCELVAVSIIPAGVAIVFFSKELILAWTGSVQASQHAGLVVIFLAAGQLLQALMIVPYYLALAHGNVKLNILTGIGSVLIVTPLLIYLVIIFGLIGAGISWLIMSCCTLPIYMFFLHRRFLPGASGHWYLRCVVRPLFASLPCFLIGRWLIAHVHSRFAIFCIIGLVWLASTTLTVIATANVRSVFRSKYRLLFTHIQ